MSPAHDETRPSEIAMIGVPTALGGHLAGMELTPAGLRELGLVERLRGSPGLAHGTLRDAGDLRIEPGFKPDPDPRAKNRGAICEFLPRERDLVAGIVSGNGLGRPAAGQPVHTRILVLGGDCTVHAGAMAGLRAAYPERRLAIAWFDAHGDFNTPDRTPSGCVWGMPFAMICGRGDDDLVAAASGPTVRDEDAALFGGQVLDEAESRALAASAIAHFGAGMLGTDAGQAAVQAWAAVVRTRVDGLYLAFDTDCLDGADGWAVTYPEPDGLSLETALRTIRGLAAAIPVVGFGPSGITLANGDAEQTVDAVARLAEAALGQPAH
jgi:arginase